MKLLEHHVININNSVGAINKLHLGFYEVLESQLVRSRTAKYGFPGLEHDNFAQAMEDVIDRALRGEEIESLEDIHENKEQDPICLACINLRKNCHKK